MKIILLDTKTLGTDLDLSPLEKFGEIIKYETTSKDETLRHIQDAEIIITNKVVISKEVMQNSPNLKLIAIAATGMNNVDLEAAKALNIGVKNVAGYSTTSVVQHTFAMAFHLIAKLSYYNRTVKDGTWSKSNLFTDVSQPFNEIAGKSWGIIGLGTIGKEVAHIAQAFGVQVNYYSTSGRNKINDYHHYELEELLKKSDIISIHCPLNEKTENLINESNLSLLKNNAILLNLGRGGIINEQDLAQALDKQKFYTGLDVITTEPISTDNPLMHIKNRDQLLITPHMAWASVEAREKLLVGIVNNIEIFLKEKRY